MRGQRGTSVQMDFSFLVLNICRNQSRTFQMEGVADLYELESIFLILYWEKDAMTELVGGS